MKVASNPELLGCSGKVPFIFDGLVSLSNRKTDLEVLRLILSSVLPFSADSACGFNVVLRGIKMALRPVQWVYIKSELVAGVFPIAVCPTLLTLRVVGVG